MSAPVAPVHAGLTFPKTDRLLRRSEFLAVQASGTRVHTPRFVLALLDRGDGGGPRIGLTASRKSADAVGRNRARRILREVFRKHREAFPRGYDCVVIARENLDVSALTLASVRDELLAALSRPRKPQRPPGGTPRRGPPGQRPPDDTKMGQRARAPGRGENKGPKR
jgi:ribonuclease P protein component